MLWQPEKQMDSKRSLEPKGAGTHMYSVELQPECPLGAAVRQARKVLGCLLRSLHLGLTLEIYSQGNTSDGPWIQLLDGFPYGLFCSPERLEGDPDVLEATIGWEPCGVAVTILYARQLILMAYVQPGFF